MPKKCQQFFELELTGIISGTTIYFIWYVEATHIVSIIAEKMQQCRTTFGHYLWYLSYGKVVFVHQTTKYGQQRRSNTVAIINIQMIPATFCGEILQMQSNLCRLLKATGASSICPVCVSGINQPTAFNADRIVAQTIMDNSFRLRQPIKISMNGVIELYDFNH